MRNIVKIPVISTAIYASGDVFGTKINLGQFDGKLVSINITDDGNQGGAGAFYFFDGDPGAVPADNAAFTFPTGALAKCIGFVASPTFQTLNAKKIGTLTNIQLALKSSQLYVVYVVLATPTQVSVGDVVWKFGLQSSLGE